VLLYKDVKIMKKPNNNKCFWQDKKFKTYNQIDMFAMKNTFNFVLQDHPSNYFLRWLLSLEKDYLGKQIISRVFIDMVKLSLFHFQVRLRVFRQGLSSTKGKIQRVVISHQVIRLPYVRGKKVGVPLCVDLLIVHRSLRGSS
jgi:hypothetical protein